MDIIRQSMDRYLSFKKQLFEYGDRQGIFCIIGRNSTEVDEKDGNGSGKSAFASAPLFAFFGRSRGVFDKDLVNEDYIYLDEDNVRADKCLVSADARANNEIYRAIRGVTSKGTQSLKFLVSCDDIEYKDLTLKAGENKRTGKRESGIARTQQRINDTLGYNVDVFINSAYFEQSNIDTFARGGLTEKDNIVKAAAGTERWSDYARFAADDEKAADRDIDRLTALIDDIGNINELDLAVREYQTESTKREAEKRATQDKIGVTQNKIDALQREITVLEEKANERNSLHARRDALKQKIATLDENVKKMIDSVKTATQNIKTSEKSIVDVGKEIDELTSTMNEYKAQIKDVDFSQESRQSKRFIEITESVATLQHQINENIKEGQRIPTMDCPLGLTCEQLTPEEKEKYRSRLLVQWKQLNDALNTIKVEKQNLTVEMNLLITAKRNKEEVDRASSRLDVLHERIEGARASFAQYTKTQISDAAQLKTSREDLKASRMEYDGVVEALAKVELVDMSELSRRLNEEIDYRTQYQNEIARCDQMIADIAASIRVIEGKKERAAELNREFLSAQDRKALTKYTLNMLRKEIPHVLVKNVIPEIRDYARRFMYKLSAGAMDIDFRLDRTLKSKSEGSNIANAFDIYINVDGRWLKYAQTSGGERARADVAIHLAWICFKANQSRGRIDNIWLDEVGAALDKRGVECFIEILTELRQEYGFKKIFVITQNVEMKRMIDNVISVVRTNDGSVVKFI